MAHDRPFRFGIQLSTAPSGAEWAALARKAEDLGYSTLFLPDHFGDQLAPLPAMQAAADATTELRVGALVFDNDFKHPVVLAKEIATVDVLSGGRVELGLGAGWMTTDYEQSGIPQDPPALRVSRMEESIAVLKGLFADGALDFAGEHYTITGLDGRPKPLQRPHPPLLVGGGGRRVLGIAAREAQIVGINPSLRSGRIDAETAADATAAATDRKLAWVREAAGARFPEIELSCLLFAVVETTDAAGTAELMAGVFGIPAEEVREVPHALIGTVEEMCDLLEARRERWGLSYVVVQGDAMDTMAPVVARLAGR
ncbi:TIGR03621 family F420-dependent LLM class oxidoreductase [Rhabdothermincola sp.]|uniref:TIGR03621 family F420-dependent LLM class oxidoreductase n=1 Tax=Rhabdothermincola sp. TaxID=2820405 RepID=UPI002FDF20D2